MTKNEDLARAFEAADERIGNLEEDLQQRGELPLEETLTEGESVVRDLLTAYGHNRGKVMPVTDDLLELFKAFVNVKKMCPDGKALAPARNSICMGCHMNIPPQTYNELQRFDSLKLCPFCNRILYWDNA